MAITTGSLAEALDIQNKYSQFNNFIASFGGTITQLSTAPRQGDVLQTSDINNLTGKVDAFKQDTYLSTQSQWWTGIIVAHGDLITPSQFENIDTTISNFSKVKCRNDAYHGYGSNAHGQNADGNNNNTTCTANTPNADGNNGYSACTSNTIKTHGTNGHSLKSNTAKGNVVKSNVTKSNVAKSNVAKNHGTNAHEAQWAGYCTNTSCSPYWTWGQWTRHHQTCHWGAYNAHTTKTNTNNGNQNHSHQNNSHQTHSHQNNSHQTHSHTTQSNTYNNYSTYSHTTCSARTSKSHSTNSHQPCSAYGNCTAKGTCKHTTYIDITNAYTNQ